MKKQNELWNKKTQAEEELNKSIYTLLQDAATIKEAFIVDELQSYMDLSDPSNPIWIQPVRVRLQEKRDWEQRQREVIIRTFNEVVPAHKRGDFDGLKISLLDNLGLEDE